MGISEINVWGSFREQRKFLQNKFGDGLELSHFGMFEVKFREKFVKIILDSK